VRFTLVEAEKADVPIAKACRMLRVSRAGFYAWRKRPECQRAREDRRLGVLVREFHERSHRRYGSPRVLRDLSETGVRISRKRVARLMRQQGLVARAPRRFKRTTDSDHGQPVAPNLLDRRFEAAQPNQRWVCDTTELRVGGSGKLYLAAILDLFSRYVVGWALSAVNDRQLTLKALEMALRRRCPGEGLLHHSDRGSPYASEDYQRLLADRGIVCSMSRRGNCYDNAVMESFFSTFKRELGEDFESYAKGKEETFDYIETFYNPRRRHSTLGYLAPAEFERRALEKAAA
jgi:putative transposase